jgi:hypothetical protein
MKKNSREDFLKSGLLVGGAVYATPAAALALTGGRPFRSGVEPDAQQYQFNPQTTTLSDLIPPSITLPGPMGDLTLYDCGVLAETNQTAGKKLYSQFMSLTLGDVANVANSLAELYGPSTPIFQMEKGQVIYACGVYACCCCNRNY